VPLLLLRCRGAKSGLWREVPLLYVPGITAAGHADADADADADANVELLLIASNAGQNRAPAWYHNLGANDWVCCLVERRWRRYEWRELQGAERAAAWQQAVQVYPGYQIYAQRANRQIPVILLQHKPNQNEQQ